MKRNVLFYVLLLVVAAFILYQEHGKPVEIQEKKTVKIGAVLALSGDMSEYGQSAKDGITLAFEELQKKDTYFDYELIFEDDQLDTKRTATAANKLIFMDKVDAIISISSGTANVIAPIAEKEQIINFTYADDNTVAAKHKYSFNRNIRYSDMTDKVLELFHKREVNSVYFVNFIHSSAKRLMGALKPMVETDKSLKIVGEDWVNATDRDFKALAEKIKKTNPDAVYIYVMEPVLTLIGKELKRIGYEGEILTSYLFSYAKHKELFEGNYFVNTKLPNDEFKVKYLKRFDYEPNLGSGELYDSFNIIVNGFEKNKSTKADDFVVIATDILDEYDGAFGKLGMTEGDVIYGEFVFNRVLNGKIEEVEL